MQLSFESISLGPDETREINHENEEPCKAGQIALAIFSYVPVSGTVIGIYNAYKACKAEESTKGWEIAKIVTQIFSFLIVPQIVLGVALAIKSCIDNSNEKYVSVDEEYIKNLANNNYEREEI